MHATVNTPGVTDQIGIDVWMPVEGWNGRFQGVGGGGYSTEARSSLAGPVAAGYSAGSTDGVMQAPRRSRARSRSTARGGSIGR